MKVNSCRDISFKSCYTNKALKRILEFASDNGALFAATASAGFSLIRPLSIWITPNTEKENRELAIIKSFISSVLGLGIMLGASVPISKAVKRIDKKPEKYLKKETINLLKDKKEKLTNSKGYIFATQLFKLGIGTAVAIPKALLTSAGTVYAVDKFQKLSNDKDKKMAKDINFKSSTDSQISKFIGKTLDRKGVQNFVEKYKNTNFPMHISAITDALSTAVFINSINNNKKLDDNKKPALLYNAGISTALCIAAGYIGDKMLDKKTERFINKFKQINKYDKNLDKQVQGIKIAKPILILGTVYYVLIPLISTFFAEQADKTSKYNLISK